MLQRVLGRSGIEVSALGLGCWAIGGDGAASFGVARKALELKVA